MSDHIQRSHGRAGSVVPEVREVVCLRKSRLEKRASTSSKHYKLAPSYGPSGRAKGPEQLQMSS